LKCIYICFEVMTVLDMCLRVYSAEIFQT